MAQNPDSLSFHSDFDDNGGDVVLRSSDAVHFRTHKLTLSNASPVFRDMFTIPGPPDRTSDSDPIPFSENSTVVDALLRLISAMVVPEFPDFGAAAETLRAADKYLMRGAVSILRLLICSSQSGYHSLQIYAIACKYARNKEAKEASKQTLIYDLGDVLVNSYVELMDPHSLLPLLRFHSGRKRGIRSYFEADLSGHAKYYCRKCQKSCHSSSADMECLVYFRPLSVKPRLWEMDNRTLGETFKAWRHSYEIWPRQLRVGMCRDCPLNCISVSF
jgi:hypothetical protein